MGNGSAASTGAACPSPLATESVVRSEKLAPALVGALMVSVQGPLLTGEHAPLQPESAAPAAGVAVSTTCAPTGYKPVHTPLEPPHAWSAPPSALTVPLPVVVTLSV